MNPLNREGPLTQLGAFLSTCWTGGWYPARRSVCFLFGHEVIRTDGMEGYTPVTAREHCIRCGANRTYPE